MKNNAWQYLKSNDRGFSPLVPLDGRVIRKYQKIRLKAVLRKLQRKKLLVPIVKYVSPHMMGINETGFCKSLQ